MGTAVLCNMLSIYLHWALSGPGGGDIHSKAGQSHSAHLGRQKNPCPCQESNPTHPANCQTHYQRYEVKVPKTLPLNSRQLLYFNAGTHRDENH